LPWLNKFDNDLINSYGTAMKLLVSIPVSMLLAGTLFAAAAENNNTDARQPVAQQQKPAADSKPQRPAPATTFTPSEKVGADSAVSFPVDI
jgi:hypothetical protein